MSKSFSKLFACLLVICGFGCEPVRLLTTSDAGPDALSDSQPRFDAPQERTDGGVDGHADSEQPDSEPAGDGFTPVDGSEGDSGPGDAGSSDSGPGSPANGDAGTDAGSNGDSGVSESTWTEWPFLEPGGQLPLCLGLSGDGQRMVIGQRVTDNGAAADRTFTIFRSVGLSWEVEQRITVGAFVPEAFRQGSWVHSCDLNGDGTVVAVGFATDGVSPGPGGPTDGVVFVATRTSTSWTLKARLSADVTQSFGQHVSLTMSGTRIAVGGANRFFSFDSSNGWDTWTRSVIVENCRSVYGEPGYPRLSPDGNLFVANSFVMRRTNGSWSQARNLGLQGPDVGTSLSRDGARITVGRPDNQNIVFEQLSADTFAPVGPNVVIANAGFLWLSLSLPDGSAVHRVHRYGQGYTGLFASTPVGTVRALRAAVRRDWRALATSVTGNVVVATGDYGVYTFSR